MQTIPVRLLFAEVLAVVPKGRFYGEQRSLATTAPIVITVLSTGAFGDRAFVWQAGVRCGISHAVAAVATLLVAP